MRRPLLVVLALLALAPAASAASAAPPSAATAPTRSVDAGGVRLAYRSVGSGRPLVLVMGVGGTMDAWDPRFVDALVRRGHRVVLFDNEGMGGSRLRPGTLTIARMADDTAALIRALRLGRPDVLGWSMGGMIGQSLAVRHPASLRRLVLLATAPGDGFLVPASRRASDALLAPDPVGAGLFELLFPPAARAAQDAYVRAIARRRGAQPTGAAAVSRAQVVASGTWLFGRDPDGARVRRLRLPVLVAGGGLDEIFPLANQRHLAAVIPRARLVTYPDAAHGFLFQHGTSLAARVGRFLGG